MASAHVYRDAIRYKGKPPTLSLLIAPAVLEAERLFEQEYIDNHHVGCVVLSEADDLPIIIDFIFEPQTIVGS
jgi:predicted alternative tryptophan synthase beta-subunit